MKPVFERAAAAAIVALALGLACVWVFRVPLFQQPDENAHADYAFALFAAHGPIRASAGRPATDVDPVVRYLEEASGFRAMRFSGDGRVPPGYGSAAFDRALDVGAPHTSTVAGARSDVRVPWVAAQYPYLYYALDALAIGVAEFVGSGSVLAEFFGARLFNVALLGASLILTYLTLRELGFRPLERLALLAAIGWFPLTSWVSAYIQPDNLALSAVALMFYLSLRLRRESNVLRAAAWFGLALGVLALTKPQYLVAVAIPALGDRTLRSAAKLGNASRWSAYLALALGPALVLGASAYLISSGVGVQVADFVFANGDPLHAAAAHGPLALLGYVLGQLGSAWTKTYEFGLPFYSYWGMISWTGYRIEFGSPALSDAVFLVVMIGSVLVSLWTLIGLAAVWERLVKVARKRSPASAVRLLLSDVILNAYLLFMAIIFAIWVATGGALGTQGRYWLPLILAATLCAVRYAPRAIRARRVRSVVAMTMLGALVLYSCVGAVAALAALEARFYRPPQNPQVFEYLARFTGLGKGELPAQPGGEVAVARAGSAPLVRGWAIDSHTGRPALRVDLVIDNRIRVPARYGLASRDALARIHDDALLDSGFEARLPATLRPGVHSLALDVYERNRPVPYPSRAYGEVRIVPR
jgi:hypothetical protein